MIRKNVEILAAVALVVLGLAVVRPRVPELYERAWTPVVQDLTRIEAAPGEELELNEAGDYVVFLEGPALDPLWSKWESRHPNVAIVDEKQAVLATVTDGIGYRYEVDGRIGMALAQVAVDDPGTHALRVLGESGVLEDEGFYVAVGPAGPIAVASWKGAAIRFAGGGAGLAILMIIALLLVRRGMDSRRPVTG